MCIMDLAIAQRAYWQRVLNLVADPSGVGSRIPRNANRIALIVADTLGNPLAAYVGNSNQFPQINTVMYTGTTTLSTDPVITLDKVPAFNSMDLFVTNNPPSCYILECIIDPDTSRELQRVSETIGK